ncbi:MAG: DUF1127 domain-containing protein [Alphaproteobacteria bacterium]|nr:DUF1127 domain-containing protein [Alphaproteobacteria bacterium]
MPYSSNIAPHVSSASFGQVVVDAFADLRDAVARRRAYRTTARDLNALSDYELADIGVTRDMITDIARSGAARL